MSSPSTWCPIAVLIICGCKRERKQPLGKGTTLAARLLQLSSSASAPNTREHISWLLFTLSDQNAEQFILNIGYGYASGFLLTHNIPLPASSDMPSASASSRPINPITGQTLDYEPTLTDPFAGMSQEEKEREAERLFVLFERHATTLFTTTPLLLYRSSRRRVRRAWANVRLRR